MRAWSQRSLNSLRGVHPDLRRVMDRALQESPLDFTVIEGMRTVGRQRQLVAQGASQTMNSRHLTGHAVDLLPIGPDGKGAFDWPLYHRLAPAVKAAAEAEGVPIKWGGDWQSFKDGPHFELERKWYPADRPHAAGPLPGIARVVAEKPAGGKPVTPKPVDDSIAPETSGNLISRIIAAILAMFGGRK